MKPLTMHLSFPLHVPSQAQTAVWQIRGSISVNTAPVFRINLKIEKITFPQSEVKLFLTPYGLTVYSSGAVPSRPTRKSYKEYNQKY